MVELSYPDLSAVNYVRPATAELTGLIFGPFGPNGAILSRSKAWAEFDGTSLLESKGINGENNVVHMKTDGETHFHPAFMYGSATPTAEYPDRWTIPWDGVSSNVIMNYGYCYPGKSFLRNGVAKYCCAAFRSEYLDFNTSFACYVAVPYSAPPYCSLQKLTRYVYRFKRVSTNVKYWIYEVETCSRTFSGPLYPQVGLSLHTYRDFEYLHSLWILYGEQSTRTVKEESCPIRKLDSIAPPSPAMFLSLLESLIPDTTSKDFQLPKKDYGDLAMEAFETADRNPVNIWEFFRDLKNPAGMIPNLRNLKSLKGASSAYLSIKFGVLPTVDDLKGLIAAFQKVRPYLDRNGNTLLTAGYSQEKMVDRLRVKLTQRIRIALAKEDDGFMRLVQELESWGVIPTFEDIWDLVNYSFVVDWFIDVGGFLERVDTHLKILRRNVRSATMSEKYVIDGFLPPPSPEVPITGSMSWVYYRRWVTSHCPTPQLLLQQKTTFNHWLEGGALLSQRI